MARTQAERRETTRTSLLDAAADCLVESGVAGFTTAEVVRRAGLSNGALFRHFPTKNELLAATIGHLYARLRERYEAGFRSLPVARRTTRRLLEMLWDAMNDPTLAAAFEAYTAARCDAWLQQALEPVMIDHQDRLAALGRSVVHDIAPVDDAAIDRAVSLSILAMQGLALNLMVRPDPLAVGRLLDDLEALAAVLLPLPDPTPPTEA